MVGLIRILRECGFATERHLVVSNVMHYATRLHAGEPRTKADLTIESSACCSWPQMAAEVPYSALVVVNMKHRWGQLAVCYELLVNGFSGTSPKALVGGLVLLTNDRNDWLCQASSSAKQACMCLQAVRCL